jgi:hypothetical protein
MKALLALTLLVPCVSFASLYDCEGSGFVISVSASPLEMMVEGNGFNNRIANLRAASTFDTVLVGNTTKPAATLKLVIKDSSFGNPGDRFKSTLLVSSAAGIKEYTAIECIRGND